MTEATGDDPEERYAYDEPTPADTVLPTTDGPVIQRTGEPPIPVGCGATCANELPATE
jgi:hypothetical protein